MSRVLVLGDGIIDRYQHYTATRLCPEGPVPVLVKTKESRSDGGANLVANQLRELMGFNVDSCCPTTSIKTRIFADDRLMLRIDEDSLEKMSEFDFERYLKETPLSKYDAIIVSDYDKGAFTRELAAWLIREANHKNIPVFVDAKNTWNYYSGCFAVFPNKAESQDGLNFIAEHVIQKLGADGCRVDGVHFPTKSHAVRDVTGAGDCFLAAFVYQWLEFFGAETPKDRLEAAAEFANIVAGKSVEYVGTHVVTRAELENS